MDEFDQEDFADEFEMQFSEELEMMKEVEYTTPTSYCRASNIQSRKRPLEDSPFLPHDSEQDKKKSPRKLEDSQEAPIMKVLKTDRVCKNSSHKVSRSSQLQRIRQPISNTNGDIEKSVEVCKSNPSSGSEYIDNVLQRPAYSPPSSPSPPQSPTVSQAKRRRIHSKTPDKTPTSTHNHMSPARSSTHSSSPLSGKHSTVLGLEEERGMLGDDDRSKSARKSLLERYEDTYQALKETRTELEYSFSGDSEDDITPETPPRMMSSARSAPSHCHVLSRAPPGSSVTVTGSDGKRVYLRLRAGLGSKGKAQKNPLSRLQLLTIPFSQLKATVEEERRQKLIQQSDELLHSLTSGQEENGTQTLFESSEDLDVSRNLREHVLWVDKYSPKLFTELLSDDGINRTLLSWLRLWDRVVYGRPLPLKASAAASSGAAGSMGVRRKEEKKFTKTPMGKKYEKKFEYQDPATFAGPEALDETRRPKIKLALLCGAPGLGKTTLAHIIAQHAGYNVIEMNASDDRSPEIFQRKIESSTQMQAVLMPDTKPNCLIIDEIDGAPAASINVLIDFIKRKETSTKKKKGNTTLLSRPIICICNDQYAPSLRQLRQHALVLYFPPTITSRLAARLHQVVKKERMSAAMSTLIALCEKTENDIRACLNTLQFLSRQRKDLTLSVVQSANVGQKDAQRSLFSLWREIFQLPTVKKHTLNQGPLRMNGRTAVERSGGSSVGTNSARFYDIYSASAATGEFEKVANGLFENYLNIRFKDPNMEAISVGQDWLVFHDSIQKYIAHNQDYAFVPYMPYLSVAFHFLFAAPSRPQIVYPNSSYELFQRSQYSLHLLSSLLTEMPASIRRTVTSTILVSEVLPPLCEIITPSFRPVSLQLYSSRERQQLADLTGTLISYNLTYRQERGQDGQYTYVLDPNIEELTRFPGLPQKKQLTYSAKQLIAREVEVEKMRRTEQLFSGKESAEKESTSKRVEKKSDKLMGKNIVKKSTKLKPPTDFFGRVIETPLARKGSSSDSFSTHPLWFKFNEGYSNAVRKPVRIQDLL